MRTATITIHPDALSHNLSIIRSTAPTAKVLAMVKADAYGHGVAAAVPALLDADGFGVACMAEALTVKETLTSVNAERLTVLIEGVFSEAEWQQTIANNFSAVVHCESQLNWALSHIPSDDSHTRTIWLKHNTGMNRLGFSDEGVVAAAKALHNAGYQLILTSHFACADTPAHPLNAAQISRFNTALAQIRTFAPTAQGSLCNSAAIFNFTDQHHDWVRAGIALYGSSPVANQCASDLNLIPAMTLSARLMAVHTLKKGDAVGYGALWSAHDTHQIGVISIGYGDGYPRVLTDGFVAVQDNAKQWHRRPLLGRVAMDMMMFDINGLDVSVDNAVILWGALSAAAKPGLIPHIDEIAACADTISYELMCRLTARPQRQICPLK